MFPVHLTSSCYLAACFKHFDVHLLRGNFICWVNVSAFNCREKKRWQVPLLAPFALFRGDSYMIAICNTFVSWRWAVSQKKIDCIFGRGPVNLHFPMLLGSGACQMITHSGYLLGVVKPFAPSNHLVGRNHVFFFFTIIFLVPLLSLC